MGKVEKNPTQTIMNTLFEKVLTETSARSGEEIETLASAQDAFEIWD